ncbi:hypothetical protein BHE74_00029011 [Ensete ventricosum]|nr:hypothetical protein BHE74_00029011 [Ensete ventricosum]
MLAMSGGFQQGCGESSEEELSVLPRHTKVVVTGNNRTKSVLVGLQGVVKKAVGLGGWHWLVLTNGIEVKLQRNALSVIEAPTGHEEDDETECDNMQWNGSDIGKLTIGLVGGNTIIIFIVDAVVATTISIDVDAEHCGAGGSDGSSRSSSDLSLD